MNNYKKIKDGIIKCLEDHGLYEDVDIVLIDDLIFNIEIGDDAKKDIRKRGIMNNVRKKGEIPYLQANQSVGLCTQAGKMVSALYTKLGITPQEREKLKIKKAEKEDELDALLK